MRVSYGGMPASTFTVRSRRKEPSCLSDMQGFQIWVDGLLLAEASSLNEVVIVDGGRPIFIDSDLVLCGRSDYSPNRYFDGKVAHLSIFDTALDNSTVRRSPLSACTMQPASATRGGFHSPFVPYAKALPA